MEQNKKINPRFFKVMKPIKLMEAEGVLRNEVLNQYAKAHSLNLIKFLSSDTNGATAKAVDSKGNLLILKYYESEEELQREITGLYCLNGSIIAELRNLSLQQRILEIEFCQGTSPTKILNLDLYITNLAMMHAYGIEHLLDIIIHDFKNTYKLFPNYYKFCRKNHILTEAEFIIGDHNPTNYLVNDEGKIVRIDLATFQVQQPIILDLYLLLYHLGDVYMYAEQPNEILFNYYKKFEIFSHKNGEKTRNHIADNFETFILQVNSFAEYIDFSLNSFSQYYNYLKKNPEIRDAEFV